MKLSMVLIAKDEAERIHGCFKEWWRDVDEVVLVDTGSTDGTVEAAEAYAKGTGEPDKLVIGRFKWEDDFAAARNYADSLATGDWLTWCDLDDKVVGLPYLRELAERAAPDVIQFYARYDYAIDPSGSVFCQLQRERLVRAGSSEWVGRVHECQIGKGGIGGIVMTDPEKVRWEHQRNPLQVTERNEKILRRWVEEEPDNARAIGYLAFELMGAREEVTENGEVTSKADPEKVRESTHWFQRYLEIPGQQPEMRAQATRRYAQVLMTQGMWDAAIRVSLPMLAECPAWPDTLLTLAECAHEAGEWQKVIEHATEVARRGQPETLLIVNPEDYTLRPRSLIASAMAQLGQLEEACKAAQQIVAVNPGYLGIQEQLSEWLGQLARDQAAATWSNCAQLLCQHDEPERAWGCLETAPFFVSDHPQIIAARVQVARILEEPYTVQTVEESARGQFLKRSLQTLPEKIRDALEERREPADDGEPNDPLPVQETLRILDPSGATTDWIREHIPAATVDRVPDDTGPYDAVMLYGDLDNRIDPMGRLSAVCGEVRRPGGRVYVSVPEGNIGNQRTPGRRRAWRSTDVADLLRHYGRLEGFGVDDDGWVSASIEPQPRQHEVAIWTGYAIGPWHPMDITTRGLGGSETAAYRLAESLSEMGHIVTLYGHFRQEGAVKDVILRDWRKFDPTVPRRAVVAFRNAEMFDAPVNAQATVLWLEDVAGGEGITPERMEHIGHVATVSEWHRQNVLDTYDWIDRRKVIACRNGITHSFFDGEQPEREKRVVYTSSPDRGVDILLELWPQIRERVPDALLAHTYGPWYGIVADRSPAIAAHRQRVAELSQQEGVTAIHGLGQKDLAMLMRSSLVWAHPSYFTVGAERFSETSCISAIEAQAAGCRVVAADWGALSETVREGAKIDGDPTTQEWRDRFVDEIVTGLTDPDIQAQAQEQGPLAVADLDWEGAALQLERLWDAQGQQPALAMATTGSG
jgi:glycosyltransferase involved in cell wall biosynthesis